MKVIVCGGRKFDDVELVESVLDEIWRDSPGELTLLHGCASGTDAIANAWALAKRAEGGCVTIARFPARWSRYGRAAGPVRNQEMLTYGQPDLVIAFPGGSGTADMVERARRAKVETRHIAARDAIKA